MRGGWIDFFRLGVACAARLAARTARAACARAAPAAPENSRAFASGACAIVLACSRARARCPS
eukprot:267945-Pleurochrysis_carterae.AAC.1